MAAPQNFRNAFNGFNKEDVVRYLEYLNTKHQNQISQLNTEIEELHDALDAKSAVEDQSELVAALQAECESLREQLETAENEKLALEERCAELENQPVVQESNSSVTLAEATELDSYRRAHSIEQESRIRAELMYYQASGVLSEATAKVDSAAAQITELADQVARELTQLQVAVSSSKHTLQDAASVMKAIRPN